MSRAQRQRESRRAARAERRKRRRPMSLGGVPWDYTERMEDPAAPKVGPRARISEESTRVGLEFARIAASGELVLAREGIELPEMCRSCALREGTIPNRCWDTQADVLKAVLEAGRFMCHEPRGELVFAGRRFGKTSFMAAGCYGAMRMRAAMMELKRRAPRDFAAKLGKMSRVWDSRSL